MEILIEILFELLWNVPLVRILAVTIVPALLLLRYVRRLDRIEEESPALIWGLVGLGAVSVVLAFLAEAGLLFVVLSAGLSSGPVYEVVHWFLVVGLAEEACKYLMLRLKTWKNPEFNCLYDGMVYAVAVSAGFALAENLLYLFRYGASVVFLRAVVSIPAHICFSVLMGTWYGAAKKHQHLGDLKKTRQCQWLALLLPALLHGGYDILASNASGPMIAVFILCVVAMFIVCWRMLKHLAEKDHYLETHSESA